MIRYTQNMNLCEGSSKDYTSTTFCTCTKKMYSLHAMFNQSSIF